MTREELKPIYEEYYGPQKLIQGWEIQDLTEKVKYVIPELYQILLKNDVEIWSTENSMFFPTMMFVLGDGKYIEPYRKPLGLLFDSVKQEHGEKYNRRYLNKKKFDWFAENNTTLKYWWKISSKHGEVQILFIFVHNSIQEDLEWKIYDLKLNVLKESFI